MWVRELVNGRGELVVGKGWMFEDGGEGSFEVEEWEEEGLE